MVSLSLLFIVGIAIAVIIGGYLGLKNRSSSQEDILDDDF